MFHSDNPVADYDRYCDYCDARIEKMPECEMCGEHIQQDNAVCIDGKWYCDICLEESRENIYIDE